MTESADSAVFDPGALEPVVFEADVSPHGSLSRRGAYVIIGFTLAVSLGVTTVFWLLGAWPVAGFNGCEILVAVALLRVHGRSQKRREHLLLSGGGLRIVRQDSQGRRTETVMQPAWLRVTLEDRPGRVPGLLLSARGQAVEVAAFLGEPEKRDLFEALEQALYRFRHPVFDNPQLCGD